jgi:hypothetical protein
MSAHVTALLAEYQLGMLDAAEEAIVTQHLGACDACRAESLAFAEAAAAYGSFTDPPVLPSGEARLRLMQATRPVQPVNGLEHAARLARFLDVPEERARALLEKAANPAAWEAAPFPGLHLLHLHAGPAHPGGDAGLVRFDGGATFPMHSHDGDEHTLMLLGGITFTDGRQMLPGDEETVHPGPLHGFTVHPEGCVYAQILYVGIDIPGIGKVSLAKR